MKLHPYLSLSTRSTLLLAGLTLLFSGVTAHAQSAAGVYFGAYQTGQSTSSTTNITNTYTNPFENDAGKYTSIITLFRSWASNSDVPNSSFPTSDMDSIRAHGSIPLFGWQPQDGGAGTTQSFTLAKIISGQYDSYITTWATAAQNWGHPFFLRFAHEMNGNWYPWSEGVNGNTTGQYVQAWQHVHDIFTNLGVTNVTWVWCVSAIYSGSTDIKGLYPGDNYVDWLSLDAYNRGGVKLKSFYEGVQPTYAYMITDSDAIAPSKPIIIAENGTVDDPNQSKASYYSSALTTDLPTSFPQIRAYCYFNNISPAGSSGGPYDNQIEHPIAAQNAFASGIGSIYYTSNSFGSAATSPIPPLTYNTQSSDMQGPFVVLTTPSKPRPAAGAATTLHVIAADKSGIARVRFYVNGAYQTADGASPYDWSWTVPAGTGKTYWITAKAYDNQGNETTSQAFYVSQ